MHDEDVGRGQLGTLVQRGDTRFVPLGDFAEEDVGNERPGELDRLRETRKVVGDRDYADDCRDVIRRGLELSEFLIAHRRVRSAEVNRALYELSNAATRSNVLIVDLHTGFCGVLVEPFVVDRLREGRAG